MICLICRQASTIDGLTSIHFERGEMRLVVHNIPARVCPSCGEAYVDDKVATQLLRMGNEMFNTGISEAAIDYTDIQQAS